MEELKKMNVYTNIIQTKSTLKCMMTGTEIHTIQNGKKGEK